MIRELFRRLFRKQDKINYLTDEITNEYNENNIHINHRRYRRHSARNDENSNIVLSYAVSEKPDERYLLVELNNNSDFDFRLYFQAIQGSINEIEKIAIIQEVAKDIKPGKTLILQELDEDLNYFIESGFNFIERVNGFPVVIKN